MEKVKSFDGKIIDFGDCMGCTIAKSFEENTPISGQVIKTNNFNIAQDSELPIDGFIVIGSNRHICSINEMTCEEKHELIVLIDEVIANLKELNVCQQYNVIWEEKEGNHFHVWLMPRHKYLLEAMGTNPIKKIGELFDYARNKLRTKENLNKVFDTIERLKDLLKDNKTIKNFIK